MHVLWFSGEQCLGYGAPPGGSSVALAVAFATTARLTCAYRSLLWAASNGVVHATGMYSCVAFAGVVFFSQQRQVRCSLARAQ